MAEFLRKLVLLRYALLTGLSMPVLAVWAILFPDSIPAGVIALDSPWDLVSLSFASAWAVFASFIACGVILRNSVDRFDDIRTSWDGDLAPAIRVIGGMLALVAPACALRLSVLTAPGLHWMSIGVIAAMLGFGLAFVTAWLAYRLERPFAAMANKPLRWFTPYWREIPGFTEVRQSPTGDEFVQFRSGHTLAMSISLLTCMTYLGIVVLAWRLSPENLAIPVATYLGFTFLSFFLVLTAIAFYVDRFRLPVPAVLLGITLFSYWLAGQDHWFSLQTPPAGPVEPVSRLFETYGQRAFPAPPEATGRTLIVVNAAGGGIQAEAWVARVLTGLHERYPTRFSKSVVMISGVSGGSAGMLDYAARYSALADDDPLNDTPTIAEINAVARENSLVPVAYGLVTYDLPRVLNPWLTFQPPPSLDRGRELESAWERRIARSKVSGANAWHSQTVRGLASETREAGLPLLVFNATRADSGQRFMIAPFQLLPRTASGVAGPREFVTDYRDHDLRLTTAARLSASFSYVSPICRPWPKPTAEDATIERFADGGYADNEGVLATLNYLQALWSYYEDSDQQAPFDRIVVLRVLSFPEDPEPAKASARDGWTYAAYGPLRLLNEVRVATQTERGQFELDLLEALADADSAPNAPVAASGFPSSGDSVPEVETTVPVGVSGDRNSKSEPDPKPFGNTAKVSQAAKRSPMKQWIEKNRSETLTPVYGAGPATQVPAPATSRRPFAIRSLKIVFPKLDDRPPPPLSWRLTEQQKQDIDDAWKKLARRIATTPVAFSSREAASPDLSLDELFGPPVESPSK